MMVVTQLQRLAIDDAIKKKGDDYRIYLRDKRKQAIANVEKRYRQKELSRKKGLK